MDIANIRSKVKGVVFAIFGFFIVIVLIRILLTFIDADATAAISKIWFGTISKPFIDPFLDIYSQWFFGIRIENAALLSVVTLFFAAVLFAKAATFFIEKEPGWIVINLVDLLFKLVEFVLLFRFILVLTGGDFNRFGAFVNQVSFFVYEPFAGLLPAIQIGSFGFLELSTLVAIVFVIVFDIMSENLLKSLFGLNESYPDYTHTTTNYGAPANPSASNITINVAQPGQPTQSYQAHNPYSVGSHSSQVENPPVNQAYSNRNQGRSY